LTDQYKKPVNIQQKTSPGEKMIIGGENRLMRRFYGISSPKKGFLGKEEDNQKAFYNPIG
jgi:hypothetical protein